MAVHIYKIIQINTVKDLLRGTFTPERHRGTVGIIYYVESDPELSCRYTILYIACNPSVQPHHAAGSAAPCFLGLITRSIIRAAMMSRSKNMILRLVVFFW